jgi:hypothetical protein
VNDGKPAPGPWSVSVFEREYPGSGVKLQGFRVKDSRGVIVAEAYPGPEPVAVNLETARMVAAAPELAEALWGLMSEVCNIEPTEGFRKAWNRASLAYFKATGRGE